VLDSVNIRVLGYGELAPVGCNESLLGRAINRRVEVWVRDVL
jgi:phosphate transport system substrate-binding protein